MICQKEEDVQRFEYTGSCPVKCMIHHINGVTDSQFNMSMVCGGHCGLGTRNKGKCSISPFYLLGVLINVVKLLAGKNMSR